MNVNVLSWIDLFEITGQGEKDEKLIVNTH